jgi:hypothetical protein
LYRARRWHSGYWQLSLPSTLRASVSSAHCSVQADSLQLTEQVLVQVTMHEAF